MLAHKFSAYPLCVPNIGVCAWSAWLTFLTQSERSPWCCLGSSLQGTVAWLGQPVYISLILLETKLNMKSGCTHNTISWIDTRQVDLTDELDGGWLVWVLSSTVHFQRVDSVLVNALMAESVSDLFQQYV